MTNMNYSEKVKDLRDKVLWFKPGMGKFRVTFLEELSEPFEKSFSVEGREEKAMRVVVPVKVTEKGVTKDMKWEFGYSQGKASLSGQLIFLGANWGGLKDRTIDLLVSDSGGRKNYIVDQAVSWEASK